MPEKEISLGRLFVQEAIKAGTWGFIFLIILGMFIVSIKQDIKKGIAYGADRFVSEMVFYTTHPALTERAKMIIKKGIKYSLAMAAKEARGVLGQNPVDTGRKEYIKGQKPKSGHGNQ